MAQAVKIGGFIYRINPNDDRQLQRAAMGSSLVFEISKVYTFAA